MKIDSRTSLVLGIAFGLGLCVGVALCYSRTAYAQQPATTKPSDYLGEAVAFDRDTSGIVVLFKSGQVARLVQEPVQYRMSLDGVAVAIRDVPHP